MKINSSLDDDKLHKEEDNKHTIRQRESDRNKIDHIGEMLEFTMTT